MNLDLKDDFLDSMDNNITNTTAKNKRKKEKTEETSLEVIPNCLINKKIIVRFIPRKFGFLDEKNSKHVLSGGMSENATRKFVVPLSITGGLKNPLTRDEQLFLEDILGLEREDLSPYKRRDNYWESTNPAAKVSLIKGDNYLDLSSPEDFMKYKILLLNKDEICPSLSILADLPKVTYQFVIVDEDVEQNKELDEMNSGMKASLLLGKILEDYDKLKLVVQILDMKPQSPDVKHEVLKTKAYKLVQSKPKMFITVVEDKLLDTKVFINKCVEIGLIKVIGNFYYISENNQPLAKSNIEPTFSNASIFLNSVENQPLKLQLEAKLKL